MYCKNIYRFGSVLCLTLGFSLASSSDVCATSTIAIRTGQHETYDRVVLDTPKGTAYTLTQEGAVVKISLSISGIPKTQRWRLSRATNFRVLSGQNEQGNLTVAFDVSASSKIKHFYSDHSIVIDTFGDIIAQKDEVKNSLPTETVKEIASLPPANKSDALISKKNQDIAPPPTAAPIKKVQENIDLVEVKVVKKEPLVTHPLTKDEQQRLTAIALEKYPAPVVVFNPERDTGVAAFKRGGYVMILFDHKFSESIIDRDIQSRVDILPMEQTRFTGYRIALPESVSFRVAKKGKKWEIYLISAQKNTAVSTEFITQPDFALGARLLLSTPTAPEPVLFEDPVVGDSLIAVPLSEPGNFSFARRLVDFEVIPSMQGLVIKPWHEKVIARNVPDGIEITAEGGLKLSPMHDTGLFSDQSRKERLFHFDQWKGRKNETFTTTRQKLMQAIVDVSEQEKILARMELARFYFANAMAREALAFLEALEKDVPELLTKPDFLSLRGACRILVGHIKEGIDDMKHDELQNRAESLLWQAVGLAKMQEWNQAIEKFKKSEQALLDYPDPFYSRMQILAVESALAERDYHLADQWLQHLEKRNPNDEIMPAIHYLRGVVYAFQDNLDRAGDLWRKVKDSKDRLYKVRAELALVDLSVATKSISAKQAVERLEGLRFSWRGDSLEFDILARLGRFYIDARDFQKGFDVLGRAIRLFPQGEQAQSLKKDMSLLFRKILLTDFGKGLDPLEALSLYNNFSYLIPSGEAGNSIRFHLAEKLIKIDLLQPASKLFADMIINSPDPSGRADIARRLAGVHLLDRQPETALSVLKDSDEDEAKAKPAVKRERHLLKARALSDLKRYDEAMAALPDEAGKPAQILRADIEMKANRWDDAITTLLNLVGPPPPKGEHITGEPADWLTNAALAMAKKGDLEGLDKLVSDYGAAMQGSNKEDLFLVLTRPEKTMHLKDLATAQKKLSEIDIFQGVLNTYRQTGKDKQP